jgi:hypothetical protein
MLHLKPYLPDSATLFIFTSLSPLSSTDFPSPFSVLFALYRHRFTCLPVHPCTHFSSDDIYATLHFRPSACRGAFALGKYVRRVSADTRSA